MRKIVAAFVLLASFLASAVPASAQDGFFFRPKDRIMFLGDSITAGEVTFPGSRTTGMLWVM